MKNMTKEFVKTHGVRMLRLYIHYLFKEDGILDYELSTDFKEKDGKYTLIIRGMNAAYKFNRLAEEAELYVNNQTNLFVVCSITYNSLKDNYYVLVSSKKYNDSDSSLYNKNYIRDVIDYTTSTSAIISDAVYGKRITTTRLTFTDKGSYGNFNIDNNSYVRRICHSGIITQINELPITDYVIKKLLKLDITNVNVPDIFKSQLGKNDFTSRLSIDTVSKNYNAIVNKTYTPPYYKFLELLNYHIINGKYLETNKEQHYWNQVKSIRHLFLYGKNSSRPRKLSDNTISKAVIAAEKVVKYLKGLSIRRSYYLENLNYDYKKYLHLCINARSNYQYVKVNKKTSLGYYDIGNKNLEEMFNTYNNIKYSVSDFGKYKKIVFFGPKHTNKQIIPFYITLNDDSYISFKDSINKGSKSATTHDLVKIFNKIRGYYGIESSF